MFIVTKVPVLPRKHFPAHLLQLHPFHHHFCGHCFSSLILMLCPQAIELVGKLPDKKQNYN